MQPVEVEQRARQFSTLVALQVPAGTSIGIDCMIWLTGEKFCGVKMIPPGFHLVTSAVSDAHGGTSPRSGFFLWLGLQEVVVRKFEATDECFADARAVTYDEQKHWEHGVRSLMLDDKLAAYASEKWSLWRQLTNCIDSQFASKICDGQVRFFSGGHEGAQLQLSEIPRFMSSPSSDPVSVTAECLDPSPVLLHMIQVNGAARVLAELQLAFALFIFCEDLDGLEHWKRLVHLLCRSEAFLLANQEFLFNFIQVFKRQLQNIPADFFHDIISCQNFLRPSLRALISAIDSSGTSLDPALLKRFCASQRAPRFSLTTRAGAASSRHSWRRGSECPSTASSSRQSQQLTVLQCFHITGSIIPAERGTIPTRSSQPLWTGVIVLRRCNTNLTRDCNFTTGPQRQ
jgi:A1 cistron-splicing factor AAR2